MYFTKNNDEMTLNLLIKILDSMGFDKINREIKLYIYK